MIDRMRYERCAHVYEKKERKEEVVSYGPKVAEGELVFGVCHIYASFNDTFIVYTNL